MTNGRCRGFTLLEVIVVLMISGLIAAVLIQGLSLILDSRIRISGVIDNLEVRGLQSNIVISPLEGLVPDYPDGADVFFGDKTRIRGLTLSPLQGTAGAPTGFGMALEYDSGADKTALTYFERGYDPIVIAQWDGQGGEFSYRGRKGDWENVWPPRRDDVKPTPRTVRLVIDSTGASYVAMVMAPHDRVSRIQDGPFGAVQ